MASQACYNSSMLMLPDFLVRQRDFLLEISRAITAQLDLNEVLRRVLHASVVMLAGRVGLVALREDNGDLFTVRAITGVSSDIVPMLNAKLHELMLSNTEKNKVDHDFINQKLREIAHDIDENLVQSVAMPLVFADEPLGLMIVFRSYHANISENDVQMLQSFADQAAIAVNNAQLYENIQQERNRLKAILEYSGDGVMILDASLTILRVNRAFEQMTGWQAEEAVGAGQDDVIIWQRIEQPELLDALNAGWPHQRADEEPVETLYVEGDLLRADGSVLGIGITYAPMLNGDAQLNGIIANMRDITNFRKAQEMQSVFISTVSHELRTPVALIKGYAGTLRRDDVQWDEVVVRQSLDVIEEEADRLTRLIDDLLTASKIQAESRIALTLSDVRLDDVAARSVERLGSQANNHRIELSFSEDFPAVLGDETRLRQVIDNLLTNAIKYSPQGGLITVGGRYNAQSVMLFVRDEGVGIPDSEMPHIFQRFYRVDDTLSRKTQGTGLGLYLVKAIIEAHGGSINAKSQPGNGSTFYFTIPRDESS